ncbi:MAG: B12-binding domain-containing radical SAM protein [Oscillospiraceae bacterium]|nr:B12-binding domain-containing radical SAM protein [Oscillospiraceae bacterium]
MRYEGAVFRPPSEAYSLIIQATIGCSHNACTFCSMYKAKRFRVRNIDEIFADLSDARQTYNYVERIFLADGDALSIDTNILCEILDKIKELFPECKRVGIYATSQGILAKTDDELSLLRKKGIGIAYLGAESGSDEILRQINKGVSRQDIIKASKKIMQSGIKLSVTFISGIGGKEKTTLHATETASLISEIAPHYVGLLTLMLNKHTPLYRQIQNGEFEVLSSYDVLIETKLMLEHINGISGTVFRSNHASNYISLAGNLCEDKAEMLRIIDYAISNNSIIKPEKYRAL